MADSCKKKKPPSLLHEIAAFFGTPYHVFTNEWRRLTEAEKEQIKHHYLYEKQLT